MAEHLDDESPVTSSRFADRVTALRDAEIRQTALNCFNENGCFKTDLDQVAKLVGVGKGTVYRHYGSKQLLLEATLDTGMGKLGEICETLSKAHADNPRRAFELTVHAMVDMNMRNDPASPATLSRLLCGCRWGGTKLSASTLTDAFSKCVRKWQTAGVLRSDADPTWIASTVMALVNAPDVTMPSQTLEPAVHEGLVEAVVTRILAIVSQVFAAEAA